MAKTKLTALAKEYDVPFDKVMDYAVVMFRKGEMTGTGKNTWVNEKAKEILDDKFIMPEITPDLLRVKAIKPMANKRWFRCLICNEEGEIVKDEPPIFVLFRPQEAKNAKGKVHTAEVIRDQDGVTYRHVRPTFAG